MDLKESFWVVIPHNVLSDKELTANAKLIYGEISSLTRKDGYCTAHNQHFQEVLNVTQQTINNCLKQLEEKGLISCEITHIQDGKKGTWRRIRIGGVQKSRGEGYKKVYRGGTKYFVYKREIQKRDTKENISKDIGDKSQDYGNLSVNKLQNALKNKYPIPLTGITDRRKLYNLIQIITKRKNQDDWMNDDWTVNLSTFMKLYLTETKEEYYCRSLDSLKEKAKLWREYRGKLN